MIPKAEHPNPQWNRDKWRNLNGEWEFEFDFGSSSIERKRYNETLSKTINVPFCPESELSGVGYKDFMPAVCYRKTINITDDELKNRVLINFGAVNYRAVLYVNGKLVGEHIGGYSSFKYEITDFLEIGENVLFLFAENNLKSGTQARGKQSAQYNSNGCVYSRCTGIWQTVWLEFVPKKYVESVKFYPDIYNSSITVVGVTNGKGKLEAAAYLDGENVGIAQVYSDGTFNFSMPLSKKQLWEVGKGTVYDLEIRFEQDLVKSYFGLRKVSIDGYKVCINDKPVFQRLVLDQGYYPDGIYTAGDDSALKSDIEISLDAGFNGARLHEKVFEPRFLYHADKMGYLVWGEYPDWGLNDFGNGNLNAVIAEWIETLQRDFNHPSIIGWCPLNEQGGYMTRYGDKRIAEVMYRVTKSIDETRPCIDVSGGCHSLTDIFDVHDYEQNAQKFAQRYSCFSKFGRCGEFDTMECNPCSMPFFSKYYTYIKGMPAFVSEYGGMKWSPGDDENGWGYSDDLKTVEEFIQKYKEFTEALMFNKNMFGFCYTQLYDVEQEKNGLYTYHREPKFEMSRFRQINSQVAEIEK